MNFPNTLSARNWLSCSLTMDSLILSYHWAEGSDQIWKMRVTGKVVRAVEIPSQASGKLSSNSKEFFNLQRETTL